jgi:hypothetical protein
MDLPELWPDRPLTRNAYMHVLILPEEQHVRVYRTLGHAIQALRHAGYDRCRVRWAETECLLILDKAS